MEENNKLKFTNLLESLILLNDTNIAGEEFQKLVRKHLTEVDKFNEEVLKISLEDSKLITKIRFSINKESDRGCALLSVSFLELQIEKVLKKKLIGNKKHIDKIFDFNGALGTLSNKLDLSYSLGIISKIEYDDINVIRKIRNEFAHSYDDIDFNTQKIESSINNLSLNPRPNFATNRQKFTSTLFFIIGVLQYSYKTTVISDEPQREFDINEIRKSTEFLTKKT
ncbi:MltR family transcriptional regulator [Flavobacterium sp.]|jgi:DNA-binding MltR family transcriptional regulator|uniref:MltR family transcriptional regulator n=1 Tax=Flavobacterium sp. TaxID=239 RepID=UPI0022C0577E|nr:MltR family transcriptional regulator [Flavobacterium sp.]MCZ8091443.1 MltR family transcriptional regulator [Flavobacterium sp.]